MHSQIDKLNQRFLGEPWNCQDPEMKDLATLVFTKTAYVPTLATGA